jgi:hypothetical protein
VPPNAQINPERWWQCRQAKAGRRRCPGRDSIAETIIESFAADPASYGRIVIEPTLPNLPHVTFVSSMAFNEATFPNHACGFNASITLPIIDEYSCANAVFPAALMHAGCSPCANAETAL